MKHLIEHNYCYFCGKRTERRNWHRFECWACNHHAGHVKEFMRLMRMIDWIRDNDTAEEIWEGFVTGISEDRYIIWDKLSEIRETLSTKRVLNISSFA
jgi:hypothetical protein